MSNDIYILVGFGIMLLLYIIYNYNKNSSRDNDSDSDNEKFTDELEEYDFDIDEKSYFGGKKIENEIPDVFPVGKSYLINPNTGLNKYGCNCVCHNGKQVAHLAPCCGIKEVCGCPCHLGINIDHNTKCCDYTIIK